MKRNCMTFEAFTDAIEREMRRIKPGRSVRRFITNKPEAEYTTLAYEPSGSSYDDCVSPCIYVEMLFDLLNNGASMFQIMATLRQMVEAEPPKFDFDPMLYNAVKDRLLIRVCGIDQGEKFLEDYPHTIIEDLVVTYHIFMSDEAYDGYYICAINNVLFDGFGVTLEQLHSDALESSSRNFPARLLSVRDMMLDTYWEYLQNDYIDNDEYERAKELLSDDDRNEMFVLTNDQYTRGAAVMFYKDQLKSVASMLEATELLILPSSVDEIIVVPDAIEDAGAYRDVVFQVNRTELKPADLLSDSVYGYHAEDDVFYKIS